MQRGLKTVEAAVGPLVLNALVSGRDMVLGTHKVNADALGRRVGPAGEAEVHSRRAFVAIRVTLMRELSNIYCCSDAVVGRSFVTLPDWVSGDVDISRPSAARVYDYYLGGSHNFPADREMARQAIALWPELPRIMQANRAFMRRAVRYLIGQGVSQFLDIGSGIPTVGNVHEVAQAADPEARVVYVDVDPVAVAHSRAILAGDDRTDVVHADLRDVQGVLEDPRTVRLLDLSRPVGVLMVALLHFVPAAADPAGVLARYRRAMTPGSYLAVSHATHEGQPDQAGPHVALYRRTGTPMTMRSRAEVAALLDGFDLVPPGVVFLPQWRPEPGSVGADQPERIAGFAAVGRRR